jgi:hypothetical protein
LTIKSTTIGYSAPSLHPEKRVEGYSFVGLDWLSLVGVSVAIYLMVELFSRAQARDKAREQKGSEQR